MRKPTLSELREAVNIQKGLYIARRKRGYDDELTKSIGTLLSLAEYCIENGMGLSEDLISAIICEYFGKSTKKGIKIPTNFDYEGLSQAIVKAQKGQDV